LFKALYATRYHQIYIMALQLGKQVQAQQHTMPLLTPVVLPPSPSVSPFFLLYNKAFIVSKSVCWSKVVAPEEEEDDDEKEVHSEIARIRMRSNAMISKTYAGDEQYR